MCEKQPVAHLAMQVEESGFEPSSGTLLLGPLYGLKQIW